ncbi:hypothetical protein PR048_011442 [Dryococelus australis]|uniref:Uncharacterized protein n=1 Tax=Dryococelus australis TaxID=614101 RepID=A0ABQ9HMC6_9NEOP|nr:hypothetical protein PR048_011442 [Dryococelus australis]
MAAKQVELLQLEELVKAPYVSSNYSCAAVTQAVLTKLRETLDFIVEEMKDFELQQVKQDLIFAKDGLEQYQRRTSLRSFGITEESQENTDVLALDIIHNKLNLPDISIKDIGSSHRMGPKNRNSNRPRPIILKSRHEVFIAKQRLAKSGFYALKNICTIDGHTITKTDTRKIIVTCMKLLLLSSIPSPSPTTSPNLNPPTTHALLKNQFFLHPRALNVVHINA